MAFKFEASWITNEKCIIDEMKSRFEYDDFVFMVASDGKKDLLCRNMVVIRGNFTHSFQLV